MSDLSAEPLADWPGLRKAALLIAYDNGMINRECPREEFLAAERGEKIDVRFAAKLDEARAKDVFKIGIVMDDKIITLDLPWATVKAETEAGLSDFIVDQMRKRP